jgi:membrane-associated protein
MVKMNFRTLYGQQFRGTLIGLLHHVLARLQDVRGLIEWGGILLICLIAFAETGMFVGFFLPGDSLLVTAGILAGAGQLKLAWLLSLVTLSSIAGDQMGYLIGRKAGQSLYSRPDSRLFKKRHLEQAHEFYEKYGGKTIVIARFVPIIRTFCAPVAGAAKMNYARYVAYDICGGVLWVWSMVLIGYTLRQAAPRVVEQRLNYIIAGVIVVSLLPAAYHAWRARLPKAAAPLKPAERESE